MYNIIDIINIIYIKMTASLLQLVAIGSEDNYFIGNPQISYFKQIYMRYTNFSIERLQIYNISNRKININEDTTYIFKINTEYGDLLRSMYLQLKLPEIFCPEGFQFKWIKNIGSMIISEARLIINDNIVEILDSNLLHILNNMSLNKKNTEIYNSVTCNLEKYYNPKLSSNKYPYSDNSFYTRDDNIKSLKKINSSFREIPTIESLNLYIPLPFFFNRLNILNIPLCALRKSNFKIKIKLRPIRELYTIAEKKNYRIGVNDMINNETKKLLITEKESYIPYSYKKYNEKTITDFIKDLSIFNDVNISLVSYIIFLDKAERLSFSKNKYSALISVPSYYRFLGRDNEVELKIEDNNLVKEMYIFAQRNDVDDFNNWSNYSIYDYDHNNNNNLKKYQNYYLKLSMDQYKKDVEDFEKIRNSYNNLVYTLNNSNQKYSVSIKYLDNNNNIVNIFSENVDFRRQLESNISLYFSLLQGILPSDHSFLIYYGMFRKDGDNDLRILQQYFRYKVLNSKHNSITINSLKYLPLFTIENLFIKIDFTEPIFTTSLLDNSTINIKSRNAISENDITNLLDNWPYRDIYHIPYIDDNNIDYFDKSNIIETLLVKADGNPINNIQDNVYASFGKLFESYENCNVKNILYYGFSEFPDKYQPSGHLNLGLIKNLDINLKLKENLFDRINYKFNIFVYIMVYKILNIENDNISLLL